MTREVRTMNTSINYSSFVDLILTSNDDYEPYGIAAPTHLHGIRGNKPEVCSRQEPFYFEEMDQWLGE